MKEFKGKPVASSKKEAKALGYSFYWTGRPCPKGHLVPRFKGGGCTSCCNVAIGRENWKPRKGVKQDPARLERAFWKKVDKSGDCWIWVGLVNRYGYGRWGKNKTAHRHSYELANGEIPDGKQVCHTCDVRNCVNPAHLWLGEHRDNMQDRNVKKRNASRHRIRKTWKAEIIIEAYQRMKCGEINTVDAVTCYGFSHAMASLVKRAKTWHFRVDA